MSKYLVNIIAKTGLNHDIVNIIHNFLNYEIVEFYLNPSYIPDDHQNEKSFKIYIIKYINYDKKNSDKSYEDYLKLIHRDYYNQV